MNELQQLKLENLQLKKTILELQSRLIQQDWTSLDQQEKVLMKGLENEVKSEAEEAKQLEDPFSNEST